jgi:uncharacterized protein (TIGR03435 family)
MERVVPSIGLVILLSGAALSQTTPTSPVFEMADVHVSPATTNGYMRGGFIRGGRYELHTASMVDLIATAWGIEGDAVFGGPSWLESDRFEILAKADPMSSETDRQLMLRALLADRFKLVVHKEDKPMDVFTLAAGKRVLVKESEGTGETECHPPSETKGPQPYIVLACTHMPMAEFARQFRQMAGGYVTHQMVDLTGLKGAYDFTIKWTARGALRAAGADPDAPPGISFFEAVDKQLGLKLVAEKRPMPSIVVDSVNRTPTENAPGIKSSAPADPTEFEVATVKPSQPGNTMRRIQPKPGGRIEIENIPLKMLIGLAWDMDQEQDRIVGGPKWMDSDGFDIIGKTAAFPMSEPPPFDSVRVMLRALLLERFKMTVHKEDRPLPVWTLVVGKSGPKLKVADPASRSGCKRARGDSGTGSAAIPMLSYVCLNTTMAQLADALHGVAPGFVDHPAVDMTGLKGAYDFTINWTPSGVIAGGGGRGGEPGQPAAAAEPTGGISFFDAVEKQLGLKLESGQKHPMSVLVIDHVEQPAEN